MKNILFFLTMCATLFSCSSDDGRGDQPTKTAFRTVIVYMCGDNNLSDSLRQDYKEMIAGSAKLSDNVNVIVLNDNLRSTPFIAKLSGGQETIVRSWDTDFYVTTPDSMLNIMQSRHGLTTDSRHRRDKPQTLLCLWRRPQLLHNRRSVDQRTNSGHRLQQPQDACREQSPHEIHILRLLLHADR